MKFQTLLQIANSTTKISTVPFWISIRNKRTIYKFTNIKAGSFQMKWISQMSGIIHIRISSFQSTSIMFGFAVSSIALSPSTLLTTLTKKVPFHLYSEGSTHCNNIYCNKIYFFRRRYPTGEER